MRHGFLATTAAMTLAGCAAQQASMRTAEDFAFLQAGTSMHEVTNRVGVPDRLGGRGVQRWEYDLWDGSQILIFPDGSRGEGIAQEGAVVCGIAQVNKGKWLWEKWPASQ